MAGTGPARALLVGALGAAVLAPFLPTFRAEPSAELVAVPDGEGGCEWAAVPVGPFCECAQLPGAVRIQAGLPLLLNRASAADLQALRGVGPSRAEAIERDREERGPFATSASLSRVRGIGSRTAARLAPRLVVGDDPCDAPVALPATGASERPAMGWNRPWNGVGRSDG